MNVAWGNGMFVAVARWSAIYATSPDGITWTSQTFPGTEVINNLVYAGGQWVVVCSSSTLGETSNKCLTSTDGITWAVQTLPTSRYWHAVAGSTNMFVAVADTNGGTTNIASSPDGITWTSRATPTARALKDVLWNGAHFVAIGDEVFGVSADGITWAWDPLPAGYLFLNWTSTAWSMDEFIVLAGDSSNSYLVGKLFIPAVVETVLPEGFSGTQFGTGSFPTIAVGQTATGFGTPGSPYLQTTMSSGRSSTGLGRPFAFFATAVLESRSASVSGLKATVFGVPSIAGSTSAQAVGQAPVAAFGAATHARLQSVTGASPDAVFGSPTTAGNARAVSFRSNLFGAPSSTRVQIAASFSTIRWGAPVARRDSDHPARGLYNPARFGQPKAAQIRGYRASGFCATILGDPIAYSQYRALHIPPATRLGKPRMNRSPVC
jgi:hypothetical protein